MRASLIATIVASVVAFSANTTAQASIRKQTAIPAQPLAPALRALVDQREFQIVYSSDLLVGRNTPGAAGELTMDEALTQLLAGTDLTYRYLDDKTLPSCPLQVRNLSPRRSGRRAHPRRIDFAWLRRIGERIRALLRQVRPPS